MKINEWGVFVERPDGSTHEIKMYYNSQDYDEKQLDTYIQDFIRNLPENSKNIILIILLDGITDVMQTLQVTLFLVRKVIHAWQYKQQDLKNLQVAH